MTTIKEPPIYEELAESDGKPKLPWILFFNSLFNGDTGTAWAPAFTNLAQTGVPTITGRVYKLGRSLAYFSIRIAPSTDTSSTAGTTYVNNFPLTLSADGACLAISGLLGTNAGMCDSATNRIYVPSWSAVTVPLTVVGFVEAG